MFCAPRMMHGAYVACSWGGSRVHRGVRSWEPQSATAGDRHRLLPVTSIRRADALGGCVMGRLNCCKAHKTRTRHFCAQVSGRMPVRALAARHERPVCPKFRAHPTRPDRLGAIGRSERSFRAVRWLLRRWLCILWRQWQQPRTRNAAPVVAARLRKEHALWPTTEEAYTACAGQTPSTMPCSLSLLRMEHRRRNGYHEPPNA